MSYQARTAGLDHGVASAHRGGTGTAHVVGKRTLVDQLGAAPSAVQRIAAGTAAPEAVHAAAAHGTAGTPGPLPYRDTIQRVFGRHDVSQIGAHVGGRAAEGAAQMGAQAYATGDQVAFAEAPTLHEAAHEAAHVVQQRAGVALKGGVGAEGDVHERHADAVADRVVQGTSAEDLLDAAAPTTASGATAVQRKVTVADDNREAPKIEGVELTPREEQVLAEMIAAGAAYTFEDDQELAAFVKEVAKTNWGPVPTDTSDTSDTSDTNDTRVETFARSRVGNHVWASDHRQERGELRVTRTNTMPDQFLKQKQRAKLPENSHVPVRETQPPQREQKRKPKPTQHVSSAMLTSLSPGAPDNERERANEEVHHQGSVMNCEQFVAYSLWGGGVIHDWELALIYAACAQNNSMAFLYQAMGLGVAQLVAIQGESLGLDTVCTLFEVNGNAPDPNQVAHMLLYCSGDIIELSPHKEDPEQWKGTSVSQAAYIKRQTPSSNSGQRSRSLYACPVAVLPAEVQKTLATIATQHRGNNLFAPKQISPERQDEYKDVGFLKMVQ